MNTLSPQNQQTPDLHKANFTAMPRIKALNANIPFDFQPWRNAPLSGDDVKTSGYHSKYGIELPSKGNAEESWASYKDRLLRYDIYSPQRVRSFIDTEDALVAKDALIGQRISVGPIFIDCAVKVINITDEQSNGVRHFGFSYQTLKGHLEDGIISFTLSQNLSTGKINFDIESYSKSGNPLTRLFGPIARMIQKQSNLDALKGFAS